MAHDKSPAKQIDMLNVWVLLIVEDYRTKTQPKSLKLKI